MKVIWTRLASHDLESEGDYIALENPHAAYQTIMRLKTVAEHLSDNPRIGRPGRVHGTRELVVSGTSYILPYRIVEDRIEILRVLHGARKWPKKFQ